MPQFSLGQFVAAPPPEVTGNAEHRTGLEKTLIQHPLALEDDDQDLKELIGEISPTPSFSQRPLVTVCHSSRIISQGG